MELEKIVIKIDPKKIESVKEIVETLKEKLPDVIITPFRYGKLGEEIIISFSISAAHHKFFIETFTFNNIKVLSTDEKTRGVIDSAKAKSVAKHANTKIESQGWEDLKTKSKTIGKGLDEYLNEGDYREIIKISRNINLDKETIESAKNNIPAAVNNAIQNAYNEGTLRKFEVDKNIDKLIEIASDKMLKTTLQQNDLLKDAGLYAIDLCTKDKRYISELIYIANNNSIHNLVSIKAAIKFAEITLSNPELYKEEIAFALKDLNIRWLSIAVNVVWSDLEKNEIANFEKLIQFIKEKR